MMSAIVAGGGYNRMEGGSQTASGLQIAGIRRFALAQIGSRLTSDPNLVSAFWEEIGAPVNPAHPDLTVLYCSLRWLGHTFALLEFVAGETLEELVKRSDPACCEQEILCSAGFSMPLKALREMEAAKLFRSPVSN